MIEITSRAPDCKIRAYDTGEIVLSAPLTRRMRLKDGDRVQIFMCRSNGFEEMFIAKCDNPSGVPVKRRTKRDRSLRIFSKRATSILLKDEPKGIFRIGETIEKEGKELHTILFLKNYAERKEIHTV